jgi:polysaccharide export outer membrane protein
MGFNRYMDRKRNLTFFGCGVLSCALLSGFGAARSAGRVSAPPNRASDQQASQTFTGKTSPPAANNSASNVPPSAPSPAPADGSSIAPTPARTTAQEEYRIGEGDVLQISVWKEPEASIQSIVVRPDGKITMPLIKDISVVGLSPREAEKVITTGLSGFIPDANVTVIVTGINSKKVYIIGAVKREGPLAYTYRMTIMQALTEAGGLTDFAKRKKIYVLRAQSGKEIKIPFDYDAVLKGNDMEHVWLLPSDTLVVPH